MNLAAPNSAAPNFAARHIGPSPADQERMLAVTGHSSLDALTTAALPPGIGDPATGEPGGLRLPPALAEEEALAELRRLASRNTVAVSMIGLGYYGTITPAVIRRNLLENPGWYTAYTPYQPEISQGRLEALLNFQTMVADLTGLPVAGASLLDEATAAAEAMTLARRGRAAGRRPSQCSRPGPSPSESNCGWPRSPPASLRRSRMASCSACCCSTRGPAGRSAICGRSSTRPATGER